MYLTIVLSISWAVSCLLRLARIAPVDPMAILRYIIKKVPESSKIHSRMDFSDVADELSDLNLAISTAQSGVQQQDVQHLLQCIHVAIQFRLAARQKRIGEVTAEVAAGKLLEERSATVFNRVGLRAMLIGFAITPRSMFGVLLLSYLGLNTSVLSDVNQDKIVSLINLLIVSNNEGSFHRAGVPTTYAPVVDYIVERLIPSIE